MSEYSFENILTIAVLLILSIIYLYLLLSPTQPRLPTRNPNFVIKRDTMENFLEFMKGSDFSGSVGSGGSSWYKSRFDDFYDNNTKEKEWGAEGKADDFFLDVYQGKSFESKEEDTGPVLPSTNFQCKSAWLVIKSEMNYRYLWMHSGENMWMGATATMDTPIHRKSFKLFPVNNNCSDGGWVLLREGDSDYFIMMESASNASARDPWVVKLGTKLIEEASGNPQYHFLFENEGYVLNKGSMAFINVMPESEYTVRGHSSGWDKTKAAKREYGAMMHFQFVNESLVEESLNKEKQEILEAFTQDQELIAKIKQFPISTEKRVISFGLYGSKPKYTTGAIKNVVLQKIYFPGWICRFYVTNDVPQDVIEQLKSLGAEIESIPSGMGYTSGMFWRFLVAIDPTVDRYIVRDSDSRLNARDRMAVEEWIDSKYPIHILRDHVNHCIVMNGGMWGGIKDAVPNMKTYIEAWTSRDEYMADLHFLEAKVWPDVKNIQVAHDSYCCDRFPNARPYPTKRAMTYQHVGQVFDDNDNARLMDIDGFIRGVPVPGSCRKHADWIYG
eukprot:gene11457-15349_t